MKVVDRDSALIEDFYEYLMYERCFSTKTCTEYANEVSHFIDYYNLIHECGAKSQFLTDKSESLMVLYKH